MSKTNTEALGVKDAMQHYVGTLDAVDSPSTTIKKLLKQALDPDKNCDGIQKARTIAEIWEQAAIDNGYEPPVDPGDTAVVGTAIVGTSTVG